METTPEPPELVPIGEAARILGVSVKTVRRWDAAGLIPVVRTPRNQRRFKRAELLRMSDPSGKVAS